MENERLASEMQGRIGNYQCKTLNQEMMNREESVKRQNVQTEWIDLQTYDDRS